jgi:predicted SAM-dependent methyltransferase
MATSWSVTRLRRKLGALRYILRRGIENRKSRYVLRQRTKKLYSQGQPVKVVIGSATRTYEGWLNTDLPVLDALNPAHWRRIFPQGGIDRILAEHVIEHWTEDNFRLFLRNVQPLLTSNGFIRIAVPDGFHPDPTYIDFVKPGGSGIGADDHKVLYNHITITRILSEDQYDYNLLEYFDEAGQFHRSPWDASDGFIVRSADYGLRDREVPPSYSSLIVDAWPRRGK